MKAFMCLTCKVDSYNKVLKELSDLNIPTGNIFLLFGPFDIFIQFTGMKSLDEFTEKWFNRVSMIGAKEALITRTLTFIVISEGPSFAEVPFAFIFIKTQPRNLEKVRRTLLTTPDILSADTVYGPYDVICPVRAKDRADFERVISYIRLNVPDIEETMTTIVGFRDYMSSW